MLQGGEIIIILLIALIVLGPKRLPELAQKLGRWAAELRAAARDIRSGLESEVAELQQVKDDLKGPLDEVRKPLDDVKKELRKTESGLDWKGPKPVSGPTPEDAMRDLEEIEKHEDGEAES